MKTTPTLAPSLVVSPKEESAPAPCARKKDVPVHHQPCGTTTETAVAAAAAGTRAWLTMTPQAPRQAATGTATTINAVAVVARAHGAEAFVTSGGSVCAKGMARKHFCRVRIRRGEETTTSLSAQARTKRSHRAGVLPLFSLLQTRQVVAQNHGECCPDPREDRDGRAGKMSLAKERRCRPSCQPLHPPLFLYNHRSP